ncbi:hypothetical protein OXX69_000518 [Metschnikowia pulcherrima]
MAFTRMPGLYRHWAQQDKERPNFIFSSDIPYKIASCVAELHLYSGGASRQVDLAKYIESFDVTLELNALLLRNKCIIPSELIQANHIYVAKAPSPGFDHGVVRSISRFPEVWKSILSIQKSNETFVVKFRLDLDKFSVDLADVSDISLHFHANDRFAPLLSADLNLTDHLKTYICQKLIQELKSNSDISLLITDSSTILQDSPPNEHIAQFKSVLDSSQRNALEFANTSLDDSEMSFAIEKQLVFYDPEDYDNSDGEIKILHSDESGKCHSNEDEESEGEQNILSVMQDQKQTPNSQELTDFWETGVSSMSGLFPPPVFHVIGRSEERHLAKPIPVSALDYESPRGSLSPVRNGNVTGPVVDNTKINDESSVNSKSEPPISMFSDNGEDSKNLVEDQNLSFDDFCRDMSIQTTECEDTISSPMTSPRKKDNQVYDSENQGTAPSLKKKASHTLIDHDDGLGLKFAFRDQSASVPEYIKENKKFKFIKVGKVQKFVNMFEEHKEPSSTASSRVGTRPGSPAKILD